MREEGRGNGKRKGEEERGDGKREGERRKGKGEGGRGDDKRSGGRGRREKRPRASRLTGIRRAKRKMERSGKFWTPPG
jgi:hypothetical protein